MAELYNSNPNLTWTNAQQLPDFIIEPIEVLSLGGSYRFACIGSPGYSLGLQECLHFKHHFSTDSV